ncbi:uncharacterized protein GIQ15_01505 [Arthroderma uncinatum]|uniref:uncharacterized protein n=1 Tax=Arthroderma uncinatum TaxID=74035 RepID=UPI00144AF20B|nr:uncharacterized protein GIQ15_01505 [Arthroderma uncinatum]KAF3491988.1 hypothetical protein GIQ15_01505 [Arthroderma uncinatum]
MFARSALVFVFFALCGLVAAFPPACVIGAVNTQNVPGDFDTVCGSASNTVQKQIVKFCKEDVDSGLKTFKTICSDAGHDIKLIDTNTSSSSESSTSSPTASSTGSKTTSGSTPTSTSGSGSAPSSTHNAGSFNKADSVFVALVVAIVGAIAL